MTEIPQDDSGDQAVLARKQRLGRIQFRSWRRGFREADMVLGPFSDQMAPTLTDAELDQLELLIDKGEFDQLQPLAHPAGERWLYSLQPVSEGER